MATVQGREGRVYKYTLRSGKTRWGFVVDLAPVGALKRRQARREGFPTRKAAQAEMDRLKGNVSSGKYVEPSKRRVSEYALSEWLPAIRDSLKTSTWQSYRRNVVNHVEGTDLGDALVQEVTSGDVGAFLAGLKGKGLSARSRSYLRVILHAVFKYAVSRQAAATNPVDGVASPKRERREVPHWTGPQLGRFLASTRGDREHPLWQFIAATGCRRGEALGLRWRDVDLDAGQVCFVQAVVYVARSAEHPHGWAFETPKTGKYRTISVDAGTVAVLREWRKTQAAERLQVGPGWRGDTLGAHGDLVFAMPDGTPVHPNTASTWFDSAQHRLTKATIAARKAAPVATATATLPGLTLHGLRHTHATLGLSNGVPLHTMSKRLGHSSVSVTGDIYGHYVPDADSGAAELIASLVTGAVS